MDKKTTYKDYHDFLEAEINAYRGGVKDYIYYLPALFKALSGTLDRPELEAEDRKIVLTALGYLVVPNDLLPEAVYGPVGYIDDVFVCCLVIERLVKKYSISFVEPYWEKETDLLEEYLSHALTTSREDLGELAEKVLAYTGLG